MSVRNDGYILWFLHGTYIYIYIYICIVLYVHLLWHGLKTWSCTMVIMKYVYIIGIVLWSAFLQPNLEYLGHFTRREHGGELLDISCVFGVERIYIFVLCNMIVYSWHSLETWSCAMILYEIWVHDCTRLMYEYIYICVCVCVCVVHQNSSHIWKNVWICVRLIRWYGTRIVYVFSERDHKPL